MAMTRVHQLADLGQAMWLDHLTRSLVTSGQRKAYVDMGLRGLTSNPAIFEEAIAGGGGNYDDDLRAGMARGQTVEEIFEAMAVKDIQPYESLMGTLATRKSRLRWRGG